MITIVIPNRNRNLSTVQRTLSSIVMQCSEGMKVVLLDYGSMPSYQEELRTLVKKYKGVELQALPTQGQLWQKTRAINIVLKQCVTPYFMVADMDVLFHPDFIKKALNMMGLEKIIFFQVGVLTEAESKKEIPFEKYDIKFMTNHEATGITLFPTAVLKAIQGFDEFYHGWGGEDTDVHVRLANAGHDVHFYDDECLFLHQWHPKHYRSKNSLEPFHSGLERINQAYLRSTTTSGRIVANSNINWGEEAIFQDYEELKHPVKFIKIPNTLSKVKALCFQLKEGAFKEVIRIEIYKEDASYALKTAIKKITGKYIKVPISMDDVNNMLLETIISAHRNKAYDFYFDRAKGSIRININFKS